jgi:hypothetical protein
MNGQYVLYEVNLYANFDLEAFFNDEKVAILLSENTEENRNVILTKNIYASSGMDACMKFRKWQQLGLDESYLLTR